MANRTISNKQEPRPATSAEQPSHGERIGIFGFGLVFVLVLIGLAVLVPEPRPFQYTVFRIVLALAAAGVAALLPGFIQVHYKDAIRAGGALGVFIVVYFFSPADLVIDGTQSSAPPSASLSKKTTNDQLAAKNADGPIPNLTISYCDDWDYYGEDQAQKCKQLGSFGGMADGPFRINGGATGGKSHPWTALLLKVSECEVCRVPKNLEMATATYSVTPCSLLVSVDPNKIKIFNKQLYSLSLHAKQNINLTIGDAIKDGEREFLFMPNPAGCDLVLSSVFIE